MPFRNIIENNDIRFIIRNNKGEKINIIDDVECNNINKSYNNADDVPHKYIIQNLENVQPAKTQTSLYIISLWNTVIDDIVYNIIVKLNNQIIINDWVYEESNYFMYNINYNPYLTTKKQDDAVLEVLINKYNSNCIIKCTPCVNNRYYNIIYSFIKPKLSMLTTFTTQEFKTTDSTSQETQEFKTTDSTSQETQEFKTTDSTSQDVIIDIREYKHEYTDEDTNVEDVNVEDVNFEDVNFEDVNVEDVNVEDVNVEDVNVEDVNVGDANYDDANFGDDFEKIDITSLGDILDNSTDINAAADKVNSLLDKIDIKNLDSTYINKLEYASELP